MDEFIAWLSTGLIIIAILFVLFGGKLQVTPIRENITFTTTTTLQPIVNDSGVMLVGPEAIEAWRAVEFKELNVSYGSEEMKYGITDKRLFNGLLFGANKIEITAKLDLRITVGAYLSFDVKDTNNYGSLIIKVNDNIINKSKLAIGTHRFFIDKSLLKEENKIEIIPTSSNWKIWAPTVYDLKNIYFVHQELYSRQNRFYFIIYESEYNNLANKEGKISLDLTERKGRMKIILNGNEVFAGEIERSTKTIQFNQTYLKSGENIIEFIVEENGLFQGYANLLFYFNTVRENTAEKSFLVSSSAYTNLHKTPGTISFVISNILTPGGFSIIIEDENKIVHPISYEMAKEKSYTYLLYPPDCSIGYNTLRISSIDDGVFYVKDLEIRLS